MAGDDGHRQQHADPGVGLELGEAVGRVVRLQQRDLPAEVQGDHQQEAEVVGAEVGKMACQRPGQQRQHGEQAEPAPRCGGETAGRRAHADDGVVALVLHGVDRVVDQGPGDAADIERDGGPGERAGHRGIAHQRAPVEGQPQHDLRPVGEALHRRIDGDQDQRQQRHAAGELVELEQDRRADGRLQHHPDQRIAQLHLARRQRPAARALDLGIDLAVDDVVPGAARAAHGERAQREQRHPADQPAPFRRGAQRRRPPAGQHQQPDADRPVPARQPAVGPRPGRQVAQRPVLLVDVGEAGCPLGGHGGIMQR